MHEPTDTNVTAEPATASVREARIVSLSGRQALVDIQGTIEEARIAFSCLVQPLPDDMVLCTTTESGMHHILGIIERPGSQNMALSFPADATMVAEEGSVAMVSGKSVTLAAGDTLTCFSNKAIHKSREAVVDYDELTAKGTNLQATYKTVRLISQMITTMARQCIEKMKNYIRHTGEYDQVKAGNMSRKVDGLYSMDSRHTVMISKKDTKIDGERIHMG